MLDSYRSLTYLYRLIGNENPCDHVLKKWRHGVICRGCHANLDLPISPEASIPIVIAPIAKPWSLLPWSIRISTCARVLLLTLLYRYLQSLRNKLAILPGLKAGVLRRMVINFHQLACPEHVHFTSFPLHHQPQAVGSEAFYSKNSDHIER